MKFAELKNHQRELYYFQLRIGVAGIAVLIAFGALLSRFIYLQVVQRDYYHTKAEDNRISIVPIPPNRGLIMDRNGVVLARNYSAYTLEIMPAKVANVILEGAAEGGCCAVVVRPEINSNRLARQAIERRIMGGFPVEISCNKSLFLPRRQGTTALAAVTFDHVIVSRSVNSGRDRQASSVGRSQGGRG